jgi:UDP-glucose 4-epimerase
MNILVLGGSGFLGGHLIDGLLADGHCVTSVDVAKERYRQTPSEVNFIEADFGNRGDLANAFGAMQYDVVVHLVSTTLPLTSNMDPLFDISTNLIESVALLDLCIKYKIKKFVYFSSGGTVYGSTVVSPISEDHPTLPICSYGIVKLAFEKYIQMYHHLYGMDYSILRISNPYGPRQDPSKMQGAVGVFIHKILKNQKITIWGDGSVIRDYIYVGDVIEAALLAIQVKESFLVNIGSGVALTLTQLIKSIESVLGVSAYVEYQEARLFDTQRMVLDCNLAKSKLGWSPKTNLEEGIKTTSKWLLEYKNFK